MKTLAETIKFSDEVNGWWHVISLRKLLTTHIGKLLNVSDLDASERLALWRSVVVEVGGYDGDSDPDLVPLVHRMQSLALAIQAALGVTATADPRQS